MLQSRRVTINIKRVYNEWIDIQCICISHYPGKDITKKKSQCSIYAAFILVVFSSFIFFSRNAVVVL
jgi:hypothetical protein